LKQSIYNRIGHLRFGEIVMPLSRRPLANHHCCAGIVARDEDIQEMLGVFDIEISQAKIVKDEEARLKKGGLKFDAFSQSHGQTHFLKDLLSPEIANGYPLADRRASDRDADVAFANTGSAFDNDVLGPLDPITCQKLGHFLLVQASFRREDEVLVLRLMRKCRKTIEPFLGTSSPELRFPNAKMLYDLITAKIIKGTTR
jgi:hypothetical protein